MRRNRSYPDDGEFMKNIVTTGVALAVLIMAHTCRQSRERAGSTSERQDSAPLIEISPLDQGRGQWKTAASNAITVFVTAPGAERVRILGRPEGVEEDYLEFQELDAPVDHQRGRFESRLNLAPDFAGQVWGEASYRAGALHVYPDVYGRGAFALESLRAELQSAGVSPTMLDDQALLRILDHVSVNTQFVIKVADIRRRRWGAGRKLPLIVSIPEAFSSLPPSLEPHKKLRGRSGVMSQTTTPLSSVATRQSTGI